MAGAVRGTRGAWGEDYAAVYLRRHGYRILTRNYSCRFGEIDIIASDQHYVVFVEVKLRARPVRARRRVRDTGKAGAHPHGGVALAGGARDGAAAAL